MIKEQDIPREVWWVWSQRWSGCYGIEDIEKMESIISKYPQHFPWETKYNSIPQEIHDAYRIEKDAWFDDPYNQNHINNYKGFIPTLLEMNEVKPEPLPVPKQSVVEMMIDLFKMEEEKRKRQEAEYEKNKALWDKHYKPYGLEYRK